MNDLYRPIFPFCALLGQSELQRALLLLAIDPRIGGVLIMGPRGTAKSTSARALAEFLPGGAFVTLPLGATEEMLIGTLDVEAALQGGDVRFAPGLLAKAHGGVLYVDEVNLLPDVLVDQLLDVAASGVNVVERDGISHEHAAQFALIGTMNPEEGELRPQLLDRFGFALTLESCADAQTRREIVKARLAFDEDPQDFRARHADSQAALLDTVLHARSALAGIHLDDAIHDHISRLCLTAAVEGMRADLIMARASKALAALYGDTVVSIEHVDAVAELALAHRRSRKDETSETSDAGSPRTAHQDTGRNSSTTPQDRERAESQWGALAPPAVTPLPARAISMPAQKKRP